MAAAAFHHGLAMAMHELGIIEQARRTMNEAQFKEWQRERTAERRHREMCTAIRDAGERAGRGNF
jgi:hypothetical protein